MWILCGDSAGRLRRTPGQAIEPAAQVSEALNRPALATPAADIAGFLQLAGFVLGWAETGAAIARHRRVTLSQPPGHIEPFRQRQQPAELRLQRVGIGAGLRQFGPGLLRHRMIG